MKTTGVSCVPKFWLLVILGHPIPHGTSSHVNGTTNSLCCCYCAHSGHSARLLWRGFVSGSICLFCPPTICLQDWPGRGNLKLDTFLTIVMIMKAERVCIRRIYLLCWKGTLSVFLLSSFSSASISFISYKNPAKRARGVKHVLHRKEK